MLSKRSSRSSHTSVLIDRTYACSVISRGKVLTDVTVLSFKPNGTQTVVSFVCKTGLTGGFVLAMGFQACVLGQEESPD